MIVNKKTILNHYEKHNLRVEGMLVKFKKGMLTPAEFVTLNSREKWDLSKHMSGVMWCCGNCRFEQGMELTHASPFHGASVHCSDCDHMLTHRTGGGMNNSFNYTFKKIKTKTHGKHTA